MSKITPIKNNFDDSLYFDVLPELRPEFIEKIMEQRQMFPHTKLKNDEPRNK